MIIDKDLVIVGAGPAGIAAAIGAHNEGIKDILVIEREKRPGGILNQCIHDGFGLVKYGEALSGPEYADRVIHEAVSHGIEFMTNAMVIGMTPEKVLTVITPNGETIINAKSVVFATGCRERTRGNLMIPGGRPSGIFTAGVAQQLVNVMNIMPGSRVVILGSGDIGLIMARRLTLEGAKVLGVYEIQSKSGGLQRNIQQCLYDYDIPLYLQHTVTKVNGKKRLQSIVVSEVDEDGTVIAGTDRLIECDTLILSVGLIPENEVLKGAGAHLRENGKGMFTDEYLQTSIPGVFLCGNSRKVLDLVDFVSEEGCAAGINAGKYINREMLVAFEGNRSNSAPKGVPEKGVITCTICPRGCRLTAVTEKGETRIEGNNCPRGEQYGLQELICPSRIVTSTIKDSKGRLLPIKTNKAVAIDKVKKVTELTRKTVVDNKDYQVGEVIVKNDEYELVYSGNTWGEMR